MATVFSYYHRKFNWGSLHIFPPHFSKFWPNWTKHNTPFPLWGRSNKLSNFTSLSLEKNFSYLFIWHNFCCCCTAVFSAFTVLRHGGTHWPLLSGGSSSSWGWTSLLQGHSPMTFSWVWRGNNTLLLWCQSGLALEDEAMTREIPTPGRSRTKQECSLEGADAGGTEVLNIQHCVHSVCNDIYSKSTGCHSKAGA